MNFDWRETSVVVTGGTGTFGNEAVRQILALGAMRVVVFSRDELKQAHMLSALRAEGQDVDRVRFFLGDVRDSHRLLRAFRGAHVVLHAAALKHVPACEYNPFEAVQTNVVGTKNVIEAAIDENVRWVIGLSTDKAVAPINLYGATKLCSEKLLVRGNAYSGLAGARFAVVRYGNVFGSRGSVIETFLSQRAAGRLTLTDKSMTRFWITIQSGVQFVLWALQRMRGGETFVPRLPSVAVLDVAKACAPEATYDVVGLRPGEKLHESLLSSAEVPRTRSLLGPGFIVEPESPAWGYAPWVTYPSANDALPLPLSSAESTWWLTVDEIRAWLASTCHHPQRSV